MTQYTLSVIAKARAKKKVLKAIVSPGSRAACTLCLATRSRRHSCAATQADLLPAEARSSSINVWDVTVKHASAQVSFGIHETEEEAARQYDRALIVEKGRAAKTNFPIVLYEEEVAFFESSIAKR